VTEPFRPILIKQCDVTIGYAEGLTIAPAEKPKPAPPLTAGPLRVSETMDLQFADIRFYEAARRSCASRITVDVGPYLALLRKNLLRLAEEIVYGRKLVPWERMKIAELERSSAMDFLPADDLEALQILVKAIHARIGASRAQNRRRRKASHLETLRHMRRNPKHFIDLRYCHKVIRARCGACRALYATETFISFRLTNGRRTYLVEREGLLECGHGSIFLYPVEWERDGLPIAAASQSPRD